MVPVARMPLPRVLRPFPGEAFASFIDRNARFQNVQVVSLLHRIGLADVEQVKAVPLGYGVFIEPDRKKVVAHALRLTTDELDALLLEGFDGIAFDAVRAADGTFDAHRTRMGTWIYVSGSHACPNCVAGAEGYWRAAWKLPWSTACVKHKRMLVSDCPACGSRFASWRRDRQVQPVYGYTVPDAGRCLNARGGGTRGHRTGPCDHDITTVDSLRLDPSSPVLQAQAWIDAALETRHATIAGEPVPVIEFFRILRGLSALMLYAATPDEITDLVPDLPPEMLERFAVLTREQSEKAAIARRAADTAIAAGHRQKPGSQKETAFAPTDPMLMGVLIVASKNILDVCDVRSIADRAQPLLARAVDRGGGGAGFLARLGLPTFFRQLHALRFETPRDHRFPRRRLMLNNSDASFGFEARHVPTAYWTPEYRKEFARFFEDADVTELVARQAVSLLLAEMTFDGERDAVVEAIGLPRVTARAGVRRAIGIVRARSDYEEFVDGLHREAERLSREYELVDYAERRARFRDFSAFPPTDWAFIASLSDTRAGQDGGRSGLAAAWVWSQLTQSDYRLAPALLARQGNQESAREVYRVFVNRMSGDLLKVLWGYVTYLGRGGQSGAFSHFALERGYSNVNGLFGFGFTLRHVPPLFWCEAYEARFQRYFEQLGVADRTGRAAVSMMLAELVIDMPRVELGTALGLDERFVLAGVSAAIQRVRACADGEELQNDLVAFGLEFSEDPCKVNFVERRAALTAFTDIPSGAWAEMCRRAGVGKGRAGVRSKHAAAWLWSDLMQADPRTSPALEDLLRASKHANVVYQKFVRDFIPSLSTELTEYGTQIIGLLQEGKVPMSQLKEISGVRGQPSAASIDGRCRSNVP